MPDDEVVSKDENVHLRPKEAIESLFRLAVDTLDFKGAYKGTPVDSPKVRMSL